MSFKYKLLLLYLLFELFHYNKYKNLQKQYNNTNYSDIIYNKENNYLQILYKQFTNNKCKLIFDYNFYNIKNLSYYNIYDSFTTSFNFVNLSNNEKNILHNIIMIILHYNKCNDNYDNNNNNNDNNDNNDIFTINNCKNTSIIINNNKYKNISISYGKHLMKCYYKPLPIYILFKVLLYIIYHLPLLYNFTKKNIHIFEDNYLTYYIKINKNTNKPPILFIHGVGIGGCGIYTQFINNFSKTHSIIMINIPYLNLYDKFSITYYNLLKCVENIFTNHNLDKNYILLSHSLGTQISMIFCNNYYNIMIPSYCILLDPACFLYNIPHITYFPICYNNYFDNIKNISNIYYYLMLLANYFIIKDINTQFFCNKYLIYAPYLLYIKEKPHIKTLTLIGCQDFLYKDYKNLIKYIQTNYTNINILNYNSNHGEFLYNFTIQKQLINDITYFINN